MTTSEDNPYDEVMRQELVRFIECWNDPEVLADHFMTLLRAALVTASEHVEMVLKMNGLPPLRDLTERAEQKTDSARSAEGESPDREEPVH